MLTTDELPKMDAPNAQNTFASLGLREEIQRALTDLGYEKPSPIQEKTLPVLLSDPTDIVALAQTGTGKTAAFGLPLLQHIDMEEKHTQALILCPTRELALQIFDNFKAFSKYLPPIHIVPVYGGASIGQQITQIKKGAQVIIATPGRLQDLIHRGAVHLDRVVYAVLDEADEMLNIGFRDSIEDIFSYIPRQKHTWLFSATMPTEMKSLVRSLMKPSVREISASPANTTNKNIAHRYYVVRKEHKLESLQRLLLTAKEGVRAIIFCRTKNDTHYLAQRLQQRGFAADYLNGGMAQPEREAIMAKYKQRLISVLVATDVAARGVDIADITHVINYELPEDREVYTHRSGRTARAGKEGFCYSLLTPAELYKIPRLEKMIKDTIRREAIPQPSEVVDALLQQTLYRIQMLSSSKNSLLHQRLPHLQACLADYDRDTLLLLLLQHLAGNKIKDYERAADINVNMDMSKSFTEEKQAYANLLVTVGKRDGMHSKGVFIQWLLGLLGIQKECLGRISCKDKVSFFEVPAEMASKVIRALSQQKMKGRRIKAVRA